jgi:hypothetical protein
MAGGFQLASTPTRQDAVRSQSQALTPAQRYDVACTIAATASAFSQLAVSVSLFDGTIAHGLQDCGSRQASTKSNNACVRTQSSLDTICS